MIREVKNPAKGISKKGLGIGRWSSYITSTIFLATYIIFVLATTPLVHATVFNCSNVTCLISKINQANSTTVADTINLAAGTYTLTSINNLNNGENGLPLITSKLTIVGVGVNSTIIKRGANIENLRYFYVASTGNLTLDKLILSNIRVSSNGGGIFNNGGTVALRNSAIIGSGVGIGLSGGGDGGGIYNAGAAIIQNSVIANYDTDGEGGGIFNAANGSMVVEKSTIKRNFSVPANCGGIYNEGFMVINSSSIIGNVSDGVGGICNIGTMTISNSTIAKNFSQFATAISNEGTLKIFNSTITENETEDGTSGISNRESVTLQNTIIANNKTQEGSVDCFGTITSLGNNIIGNTTNCNINLQPSDLTGDPGLGAFQDNGIPGNERYPLLSISQSIDAGSNTPCPSGADQLRNPRVDGNGDGSVIRDIGAVEFGSRPTFCGNVAVTILGTAYSDTLNGTACPDVISGLDGGDTISGLADNDIICGGRGNDLVKGGQGNDTLNGEKDHDTLMGEVGNDKLNGGDGTDTCNGGDGTDTATSCETKTGIP